MNEQEIIEGNILIAEFHGFKRKTYSNPKFRYDYFVKKGVVGEYQPTWFKYHARWEHIMPIVELISKDYDFTIRWFNKDCNSTIYNTSIEGSEISDYGNYEPAITNVWLCVVKFIKWHNQQTK